LFRIWKNSPKWGFEFWPWLIDHILDHAQLLEGSDLERQDVEKDLCFLGLIGLYDPPRLETAGSIQACYRAGIVVHVVTGDHQGTTTAIAQCNRKLSLSSFRFLQGRRALEKGSRTE
jgi:magnesium-transporting ATPase (P-type)